MTLKKRQRQEEEEEREEKEEEEREGGGGERVEDTVGRALISPRCRDQGSAGPRLICKSDTGRH